MSKILERIKDLLRNMKRVEGDGFSDEAKAKSCFKEKVFNFGWNGEGAV